MTERLKILFAGSGEFGLPTLQALALRHEVVGVYSQLDRPAGRGRTLTPTPIAAYCLRAGLALTRTADLNAEALPPADVLVVIAFGQWLSATVADHARLGAVNLHSSRLPRHRGAAPIHWAILSGDAETGNSVIRLAAKMDAGDVLGQSLLTIGPTETAGELHDRLAADGPAVVLGVLDALAMGTATAVPQDHARATVARKLSRESTRIDWEQPAEAIARQIRGLWPWPGCRAGVRGPNGDEVGRVGLARAVAESVEPGSAPGRITADGTIGTGRGVVRILEVQPEGRRAMLLSEYRNGRPWPAGGSLRSIV